MAISMALKTDHICRPVLRQKTLTKSDLEGCVLLRGSKLFFGWGKPFVLPTLTETWFWRSWVGFLPFLRDSLSVFDRFINPLRRGDWPITPRYGVTPKMLLGIYAVFMAEEEAEALLIYLPKPPVKADHRRIDTRLVVHHLPKLCQRGDVTDLCSSRNIGILLHPDRKDLGGTRR